MPSPSHLPVLLAAFLDLASPAPGSRWVDGTFGRGGHTRALLERGCRVLALDRDAAAMAAASRLQDSFPSQMKAAHSDFRDLADRAAEIGWDEVDGVLLDLGVSSPQLDDPARGFSFRHEAPLDMRMDQRQEETAAKLVGRLEEEELVELFMTLGGEPRSDARRIARAIITRRFDRPIATTADLAEVVADALPRRRHGRIHPATQVFQALRMRVNREPEALEKALPTSTEILRPGGVLAVISFHSGEDRVVKNFMREGARAHLPTPAFDPVPKPNPGHVFSRVERALPDEAELSANPRARSARLRVAWKEGGLSA